MFQMADEAYATQNAINELKELLQESLKAIMLTGSKMVKHIYDKGAYYFR